MDDNENILQGLRRNLRAVRGDWDLSFAAGGAEALKIMDEMPVDVVVSDIRMPAMDGVALLTQARARHGHTVRLVLSGQCEDKDIAPLLEVSHQYLAKPMDTAEIIAAIKSILAARDRLRDANLKKFITGLASLPSLPSLYADISAALRADRPSAQAVELLLLRDISLVAKIFQMLNSSYFGSGGDISSVTYVWESLGLERMKELFLGGHISVPPDKTLENNPFISGLWNMSLMTARISRLIAKTENLPQKTCDKVWVAGLLHAIGAVVLYEYRRASSGTVDCGDLLDAARPEDSYVDAGAFLSVLWGLPQDIQYAVRWHAAPEKADGNGDRDVLAIVHAARAFSLMKTDPAAAETDCLHADFLDAAGVSGRLADWKSAANTI
ncbi:MAG: HDOD domain-containing protein [Alphaproteobacteria bacterium]|nr:HDOD domain-containing protein [Alphaproteobacteria bacterium]MDE2336058.1 HDOD domain-containing protein [Alphaproteobacteria bacterium]